MAKDANTIEVERIVKSLMEKDLRIQCRARGLSPAGGKETLRDRLIENMLLTRDCSIRNDAGQAVEAAAVVAGGMSDESHMRNNFARPSGQQNVGNFLTGRNSSRVSQAPGGASTIQLG